MSTRWRISAGATPTCVLLHTPGIPGRDQIIPQVGYQCSMMQYSLCSLCWSGSVKTRCSGLMFRCVHNQLCGRDQGNEVRRIEANEDDQKRWDYLEQRCLAERSEIHPPRARLRLRQWKFLSQRPISRASAEYRAAHPTSMRFVKRSEKLVVEDTLAQNIHTLPSEPALASSQNTTAAICA